MIDSNKTVVIGAGIIGTYCALELAQRRDPSSITIIDRQPFAYDNASCVNLGGFAISEVQPLARPSNIWRAVKWLPNPQAPLALRLQYLPELVPWLWVFLKSAVSKRHYEHVVESQQALMKHAADAHVEQLAGTGLDSLIDRNGTLCLYKREKRLDADWKNRWKLFREQGFSARRVEPDELRELLPELDPAIRHAIHIPDIHYWTEPTTLLSGLHKILQQQGVQFETQDVIGIRINAGKATELALANGETLLRSEVVVAAGAFSKPLCRELGDNVPLDTERGYSTSLPNADIKVKHLLLLVEDEFVATPMTSGLRLGGTVELAGLKAPPNFNRTKLLIEQIKDYFPGVDTSSRADRLGFRPSVPDGLPVISRATHVDNVWYAFGHGHVGMTQSAITGKLMAQLISGQQPDIDLQPYSASRFG